MNNTELCFGQRIDPENGLVELWLTHDSLDWIKQQDFTDKIVWMFGAGLGDIWLSKRCKELHVVERNAEWIYKAQELAVPNGVTNLFYYHRPCNDCSGMDKEYCEIPIHVDVVINDDAYRFEVIEKALTLPRPLVLITDNWLQDYVFVCPKAAELLKEFESKIFSQADHRDFENEGGEWKTAIHFIEWTDVQKLWEENKMDFPIKVYDDRIETKHHKIYFKMTKTVTHIDCPERWKSLNDYDSHRPILHLALCNTKGRVVEVGMGFGSSPLISWECYNMKRHFEAFENNKNWWEDVSIKAIGDTTGTTFSKDILRATAEYLYKTEDGKIGLLFIDCAPAELRKEFIRSYDATADVILVHDTEPGADYVYRMSDILSTFKYRLDYQPEGKPHTTAVSNTIDVTQWV